MQSSSYFNKLLPLILVIAGLSFFVAIGKYAIDGRFEVQKQRNDVIPQVAVSLQSFCECSVLTYDESAMMKINPDGTSKQLFGVASADGIYPTDYIYAVSPTGENAFVKKDKKLFVLNTHDEQTVFQKTTDPTLHPVVARWSASGSVVAWVESEAYSFTDEPPKDPNQYVFLTTLDDQKVLSIPENEKLVNVQEITPLDSGEGVFAKSSEMDGHTYWFWNTANGWTELSLPESIHRDAVNPTTFFQLNNDDVAFTDGQDIALFNITTRKFTDKPMTPWTPYFITRSPSGKIYGLIDDPDVAYGRLVEMSDDLSEKRTVIKKFTIGDGFASVAWIPGRERVVIRAQSLDKNYTADLSLTNTILQPLSIKGFDQTMGRIVGILN